MLIYNLHKSLLTGHCLSADLVVVVYGSCGGCGSASAQSPERHGGHGHDGGRGQQHAQDRAMHDNAMMHFVVFLRAS